MNMESLPTGDGVEVSAEAGATGAPAERPQQGSAEPSALPISGWIAQGLRAGFLLKISIHGSAPTPWQLFVLFALHALVLLGLARFEVAGSAQFNLSGWLYPWCLMAFMAFVVWAAFEQDRSKSHPRAAAAFWGLWPMAVTPVSLVGGMFMILYMRDWLPGWWSEEARWAGWVLGAVLLIWPLLIAGKLVAQLSTSHIARSGLVLGLLLMQAVGTWQQMGFSRPWYADVTENDAHDADARPRLKLSQEVFEQQQALLNSSIAGLQPGKAGRVNVFGLVYAPYEQDVFMREAAMVADVLQQRFDASGRVLQMVNHARTTSTLPWATEKNLRATIGAMASLMDKDNDVLVLYMTSHGGSDFKLASSHWPLDVVPLTPHTLRMMLDDAHIRYRVIAVSACYSGGWIEPLSSDTTLVMTAADATHTSYGCGNKSELTFFGRAIFDEQLRKTLSFEQAFKAAVPIIAQREVEGKKTDGFSNPQIAVGAQIRPVLQRLEGELTDRK